MSFRDVFIDREKPYNYIHLNEREATAAAYQEKGKDDGSRSVEFEVKRFNPATKMLESELFRTRVHRFSTVLDALLDIKEKEDNTLAIRYSCRMGICGSCAMVVNGKPVLACETNVLQNSGEGRIVVSPMLGHPLLKDLVTDFDDFFERHRSIKPHLVRNDIEEKYSAQKEYPQSREELSKYLPFSYCIMCGLCVDACPVVNTNPSFIGPQALAQVQRYYADSRDQLGDRRLEMVDRLEDVWDCEFAGACSLVCPKGVDPAFAIQLLKAEIVRKDIAGK
ncbi:MAG: succinate dehydrogenase iron-sulfur subunit [Thermoplasmata archaeon]|uniref:succinate dehydrogenase n=1 Tax=Candidatus Sysuiplasma superficiale TaxID=2823368 RepID=A0A8J8CCQ1_9ARCH|nr:succinate dehydrogenase iron-sulfur subunit [Candidatus Sysuiplasma superficiale]MBX8643809.1 succinate dehydrogenase iron-sulfur subunit [Candidatus Sysuiplasma superficiale]